MKRLIKLVKVVFLLTLIAMSALYFFQEKLIFLPTQLDKDHQFEFHQEFDELFIEGEGGAILNALHFKSDNPKGIIVYFHGNSGDLTRWGGIATYFNEFNFDVLVMDYRTYGKSTGKLNEAKMYSDAQLFYDWANARFSEEKIYVHGRSLGCTFAAYVASKNDPKALVLETPFYSLKELVKDRYPILPVDLLLKYTFPTNEFVKNISAQTIIIHGTEDGVVPYESGKKLSQEFLESQITFYTIENGEHNNLMDRPEYHEIMQEIYR